MILYYLLRKIVKCMSIENFVGVCVIFFLYCVIVLVIYYYIIKDLKYDG